MFLQHLIPGKLKVLKHLLHILFLVLGIDCEDISWLILKLSFELDEVRGSLRLLLQDICPLNDKLASLEARLFDSVICGIVLLHLFIQKFDDFFYPKIELVPIPHCILLVS